MAERPLDLTPAAAATLAKVVRAQGVVGLQVHAGAPVSIGVHREGSGTRWFFGPNLEAALERALDGIDARVVFLEDELP